MKLKEIKNSDGKVIFTFDENKIALEGADFSEANLEDANLQGIIRDDVKLCRANLKNADFYWTVLFMSDLSEADCENAVFAGTDLKQTDFRRANLKNTVFRKDNLGGKNSFQGANFSDTNLNEAIFKPDSTEYDSKTIFPDNFNPDEKKLKFVKN